MVGLILTGALGAGKSYAQNLLIANHGFWTPITITTRPTDPSEQEILRVSHAAFSDGVSGGDFVLPSHFGQHWYAWRREDLTRILGQDGERVVLNVRPYTALVLAALIQHLLPIWIWVEEVEKLRRRAARQAARDTDTQLNQVRLARDAEDLAYEPLFTRRVRSDDTMINALLTLHQGRRRSV